MGLCRVVNEIIVKRITLRIKVMNKKNPRNGNFFVRYKMIWNRRTNMHQKWYTTNELSLGILFILKLVVSFPLFVTNFFLANPFFCELY